MPVVINKWYVQSVFFAIGSTVTIWQSGISVTCHVSDRVTMFDHRVVGSDADIESFGRDPMPFITRRSSPVVGQSVISPHEKARWADGFFRRPLDCEAMMVAESVKELCFVTFGKEMAVIIQNQDKISLGQHDPNIDSTAVGVVSFSTEVPDIFMVPVDFRHCVTVIYENQLVRVR